MAYYNEGELVISRSTILVYFFKYKFVTEIIAIIAIFVNPFDYNILRLAFFIKIRSFY